MGDFFIKGGDNNLENVYDQSDNQSVVLFIVEVNIKNIMIIINNININKEL